MTAGIWRLIMGLLEMTTHTVWFDFVGKEEQYKLFKKTWTCWISIIDFFSVLSELLVFPLCYTEFHAKVGYVKEFLNRNYSYYLLTSLLPIEGIFLCNTWRLGLKMKRNNVCHSDLFTKGALLNHQDQTYKICLNLPIQESPMITKVEVLHWWMLLSRNHSLK